MQIDVRLLVLRRTEMLVAKVRDRLKAIRQKLQGADMLSLRHSAVLTDYIWHSSLRLFSPNKGDGNLK